MEDTEYHARRAELKALFAASGLRATKIAHELHIHRITVHAAVNPDMDRKVSSHTLDRIKAFLLKYNF
jgi:hypothetical protein